MRKEFFFALAIVFLVAPILVYAQAQPTTPSTTGGAPVRIQTNSQLLEADYVIRKGESLHTAAQRISRELGCSRDISPGSLRQLGYSALYGIGDDTIVQVNYALHGHLECPPFAGGGSGVATSASCSADAQRLIATAMRYDGLFVEREAMCRGLGDLTCACFVSNVFKEAGLSSSFQSSWSVGGIYNGAVSKGAILIDSIEDLIPGDVVLMKTYPGNPPGSPYTHVGIYVGNGQIIHSGHPVDVDYLSQLQTPDYGPYYRKGLRVLPSCLRGETSAPPVGGGLGGKKIYVIPGHVGISSGAAGEIELNTAVASKLVAVLRNAGADARLATTAGGTTLQREVEEANSFGADISVSIHHDATNAPKSTLTYYPVSRSGSNSCSVDAERCDTSERLAGLINTELTRVVGASRGLWKDSQSRFPRLQTLYSNMPAVLVEVTASNDPRASQDAFQNNVVNAITRGIANYFGASSSASSSGSVSHAGVTFAANRVNLYTTLFCTDSEHGNLASGQGSCDTTRNSKFVALPSRDALNKNIRMCVSRSESCGRNRDVCFDVPVWDVGPLCNYDNDYVFGSSRPLAEEYEGRFMPAGSYPGVPGCNPNYRSIKASVDMSPGLHDAFKAACGGNVPRYFDWAFIS